MLEKIKERKVSDSSGTGACTDGDVRADIRSSRTRRQYDGEPEHSSSTARPIGVRSQSVASTVPGTASSHSTIRGGTKSSFHLAQSDQRDLNGTAKSGSSTSSHRSSFVASLGKGVGPAVQLRTIVESPSSSVAFGHSDPQVQVDEPEHHASRLLRSQQEDMNRYISSTSTANTATTAVSTSFVKHRGPPPPTPHGRAQGVRTIGLNDIPQIPRQVGNMVFDPERGWVRASKTMRDHGERDSSPLSGAEGKSSSAESVDIFAGMESLREEGRTLQLESSPGAAVVQRQGKGLSPVLEVSASPTLQEDRLVTSQAEKEESAESSAVPTQEAARTSHPQSPSSQAPAKIHTDLVPSMSPLSIHEETREASIGPELQDSPAALYANSTTPPKAVVQRPELREYVSAPTPMQTDPLQSTPAVRSILKTGAIEMSSRKANGVPATPLSAIKIAVTSDDSARRSVSFSEVRTYSKILEASTRQTNMVARKQRNWNALMPEDDIFNSQDGSIGAEQGVLPMQPSVRSKRIQNMLTDLSHNGKPSVLP